MASTKARKAPKGLRSSQLPPRSKPQQAEIETGTKKSEPRVKRDRGEISILKGGPRDGRAFFTADLDDNLQAYHPHSEGYARTQGFIDNHTWVGGPKYPAGHESGRGGELIRHRARIWRWVGVDRDGR